MLELIFLPPLLSSIAATLYYKEVLADVLIAGVILVWLLVIIEIIGPGVLDDFTYWLMLSLIHMSSSLYFIA